LLVLIVYTKIRLFVKLEKFNQKLLTFSVKKIKHVKNLYLIKGYRPERLLVRVSLKRTEKVQVVQTFGEAA